MSEESFGNRLRRERERRHIALSSISANSKINVAFLQGLERDDLSKWPSGIFRRAFIRAYAEGVGLDPDLVVREFLEHYPDQDADQPAPAQAWSPKNRATPRRPSAVPGASTTSPFEGPAATDIRLRLGDPDAPVGGGRVGEGASRRLAAVACDAAVVTAAAGAAFMATGWFWLPMSVAMVGYDSAARQHARRVPAGAPCRSTAPTLHNRRRRDKPHEVDRSIRRSRRRVGHSRHPARRSVHRSVLTTSTPALTRACSSARSRAL